MDRKVLTKFEASDQHHSQSFRYKRASEQPSRSSRTSTTEKSAFLGDPYFRKKSSLHNVILNERVNPSPEKFSQRAETRLNSQNLSKAPLSRVVSAMESSTLRRQHSSRSGRKKAEVNLDTFDEYQSFPSLKTPSSSSVSEQEKRERRRKQNSENSRRSRLRKRLEQEKLEEVFGANEERIRYLEQVANELATELQRFDSASREKDRLSKGLVSGDERPSWFGASF